MSWSLLTVAAAEGEIETRRELDGHVGECRQFLVVGLKLNVAKRWKTVVVGECARIDDVNQLIYQAFFVVVVGADQPINFFVSIRGQTQLLREPLYASGLPDIGLVWNSED